MKKSIFILGCITVASCSQKTTETVSTVEAKPASTEELAKGKSLYAEHCIKCHKTYSPSDFTAANWHHIIPDMATKAKIDGVTSDLILTYVLNGAKI